jgi:hypothetical protein
MPSRPAATATQITPRSTSSVEPVRLVPRADSPTRDSRDRWRSAACRRVQHPDAPLLPQQPHSWLACRPGCACTAHAPGSSSVPVALAVASAARSLHRRQCSLPDCGLAITADTGGRPCDTGRTCRPWACSHGNRAMRRFYASICRVRSAASARWHAGVDGVFVAVQTAAPQRSRCMHMGHHALPPLPRLPPGRA